MNRAAASPGESVPDQPAVWASHRTEYDPPLGSSPVDFGTWELGWKHRQLLPPAPSMGGRAGGRDLCFVSHPSRVLHIRKAAGAANLGWIVVFMGFDVPHLCVEAGLYRLVFCLLSVRASFRASGTRKLLVNSGARHKEFL